MLDKYTHKLNKIVLKQMAMGINKLNITPNMITISGFVIGILAMIAIYNQSYEWALLGVIINRIFDGLDGALARIQGATTSGGFLDITFDFFFYCGFTFAWGLSNPDYLLPAIILLFSFITAQVTFLSFAANAPKEYEDPNYPNKSIHYMGGVAEGTETILCFLAMLIWADLFPIFAYIFAFMNFLTSGYRVVFGYNTLKRFD